MAEGTRQEPIRIDAPPRAPVRFARGLLAAGSVVLVGALILAAEWSSRYFAPDYLVKTRGLHVFSSAYGWAGRPGAVAAMGTGRVSLNLAGYRGRALSPSKRGDATRVVVLGDSIAFGYGVADEETFPYLLDVRDNGLEAANLGMEGYGPGQELLVLQREGLGQDPDVVVLAVCLRNDFVDAVLPVALYDGVTPRPRFRLVGERLVLDDSAVRLSRVRRAVQWVHDYSHVYSRLSSLLPSKAGPEDPGWRVRKQQALRDEDYALRLTVALVLEMARLCRERGIGFLVATFPNGLGYAMRPELVARFEALVEEKGVPVITMAEHFRSRGLTPATMAIDRTGHLGPEGHALTSEILERAIVSRFRRTSGAGS